MENTGRYTSSPAPSGWAAEARQTLAELKRDLRRSYSTASEEDVSTKSTNAALHGDDKLQEERYWAVLAHRRAGHRRFASWLKRSKSGFRSRTELFKELDFWASSKVCVHQGRWFLWDDVQNSTQRTHTGQQDSIFSKIGEMDGLEFAFANAGFCSVGGTVFENEEVSNTGLTEHGLVPRSAGMRTASSAVDEIGIGVERYPLDVFWSELMQYWRPPNLSRVEWREGGALLLKEPFWHIGHGAQELFWLWNLFWPEALPKETRPLQLTFIRWAAYEIRSVTRDWVEQDDILGPGALLAGAFQMHARNSRAPRGSINRLYYEAIGEAMANSTGILLGNGRTADRRGALFATDDEASEQWDGAAPVGDPNGTLCFDYAIQPFRTWPGEAVVYEHLRSTLLKHCGLEVARKIPRRLVVVERGPSVLGGGRRERMWADGVAMRQELAKWGRCRGYEVRFVNFGALQPCDMANEAASAGILLGVHGADLAFAALQPTGAALVEVDAKRCASNSTDWESLRHDEESDLLGNASMPLPSKWDLQAPARLQELRETYGGGQQGCPFLTHVDINGSDRRRRYWAEGKPSGTGFLGRAGGGVFGGLARQRNLLYFSIQRCKCMEHSADAGVTECMAHAHGRNGSSFFVPSVWVDLYTHLIPLLDTIVQEHFQHL